MRRLVAFVVLFVGTGCSDDQQVPFAFDQVATAEASFDAGRLVVTHDSAQEPRGPVARIGRIGDDETELVAFFVQRSEDDATSQYFPPSETSPGSAAFAISDPVSTFEVSRFGAGDYLICSTLGPRGDVCAAFRLDG